MGLILMMPFLLGLLNELLGLPWAIRYLMDAAWCLLLGYILLSKRRVPQLPGVWAVLFLVYTLLTYLPQWQSPLYYLWGMRNNFRFYGAFLAFAVFLKTEDIEKWLKIFDLLFWVNGAVSLFQYFVMHLSGDYLGGLFGATQGCNGYTNLFFLMIVIRSILSFLEKRENVGICLAKCGTALVVATLAELKFFFVEFALVIALAVLITRFTWRKLVLILGGIAGILVCASVLARLFPEFAEWFSLDWLLESAASDRGYTSTGDLNRLNAIPQINELWLKNGWQQLFGLGLGNCETSTYAVLQTPFNTAHNAMHYTWLSYAMMYLETGWIGLTFYWGFFVLAYFGACRMEKHSRGDAVTRCRTARIMAVLCVVISVYNASLRTEAGYMASFLLAVPFAEYKNAARGT